MDRKRLGKAGLAAAFFAGYYGFVRYTGTGVPCLFRYIFHLQCPGCGVTHMLLALGEGDLAEAFRSNPIIFCFMPFLGWIFVKLLYHYLYIKKIVWRKWESAGMMLLLLCLILFGIVRNCFEICNIAILLAKDCSIL